MFEKLQDKYTELNKNFENNLQNEITKVPSDIFSSQQKKFLEELKKGTKIILKKIDEKYPLDSKENSEINYKSKINILIDLNKFLQKYPKIKTSKKLNAFHLLQEVTKDLDSLKADIISGNETILPDEYLKDADIPFFDHISDKIEKADTWDIKKLIEETKSIKIDSDNISKEDFDNFINDLRNGIKGKINLEKFDKKIEEFKKTKYYLESKTFDKDATFISEGLNINNIGEKIDHIVDDIIESEKKSEKIGKINIEINGVNLSFNNTKEALRTFYKIKLILSSLSKEEIGALTVLGNLGSIDYHASELVDGIAGGVGTFPILGGFFAIIAYAVGYSGIAYMNGKPVFNGIRHIKDIVTILGGKSLRELRNTDNIWGKILKKLSYNYIDPVSSEVKVSIFDFNGEAGDLEEHQTRKKIFDLAKKTSKGNIKAEKELDNLKDTFHLSIISPIGGDSMVESESYWRKISAIINENNIGKRILIGFGPGPYKPKMIEWATKTIDNQRESAKLIFDGFNVEDSEKSIDDLKFKPEFEKIVYNIDFGDGLSGSEYVSHSDEIERSNNIKELIRKVKDLEIFISPENLKGEIIKTIKGYYPNSLAIEKIRDDFKDILSKTEIPGTNAYKKQQNIKNFLNSVKDLKWIGNEAELNTAISEVKSGTNYNSLTGYDVNANDDYTGSKLEKEYDKLIKQGENLSKKDYKKMSGFEIDRTLNHNESYEKFYKSIKNDLETKILLEEIKGRKPNIGNIETELSKLFKNGVINDKLDWTSDNFNYIIRQIFKLKSYKDAMLSIDISTNRTKISSGDFNKKTLQNNDIKYFKREFKDKLNEIENPTTTLEKREKITKELEKYLKTIDEKGLSEDFNKQGFGVEIKDFNKLKSKLGLTLDDAYARLDSDNLFKGKSKEILENTKYILKDLGKTDIFDTFESNLKLYLIDNKQLKNHTLKNIINGILSGDISKNDLENFKNVVNNKSSTNYKINIDDIKKEEFKINILNDGEISNNTIQYSIDENFKLKSFLSSWNTDIKNIEKLDIEIKKVIKLNKLTQDLYNLESEKLSLGTVLDTNENGKAELASINNQIKDINSKISDINIDTEKPEEKLFIKQKQILNKFKNNSLFKAYLNEQGINSFDFDNVKNFISELSYGNIDKNLLLKVNTALPNVSIIEPNKIIIKDPIRPTVSVQNNSSQKSKPKTAPQDPETDFDKMEYGERYKTIKDYYNRALKQAILNGTDSSDLFIININKNKLNVGSVIKDKDFDFLVFESDLKDGLGLGINDELKSDAKLEKLIRKADKLIKDTLVQKGILTKQGKIKNKLAFDIEMKKPSYKNIAKYIIKAVQ